MYYLQCEHYQVQSPNEISLRALYSEPSAHVDTCQTIIDMLYLYFSSLLLFLPPPLPPSFSYSFLLLLLLLLPLYISSTQLNCYANSRITFTYIHVPASIKNSHIGLDFIFGPYCVRANISNKCTGIQTSLHLAFIYIHTLPMQATKAHLFDEPICFSVVYLYT